jgi:hypothetical protein
VNRGLVRLRLVDKSGSPFRARDGESGGVTSRRCWHSHKLDRIEIEAKWQVKPSQAKLSRLHRQTTWAQV